MIRNKILKEVWKPVEFDFEFTNKARFEVSNLGRFRSFNKVSDGNILKGSVIEGFRIVRLKLYQPRNEQDQEKFDVLKKELSELHKMRRQKVAKKETPASIAEITQVIDKKKSQLSKKLERNLKKRSINHHFMIHRLVAKYFLPAPKPEEKIVAHLNYDKFDNSVTNLKWMTAEEYTAHQSSNPKIIAEKKWRKYTQKPRAKGMKLTSSQVIHIKLMLRRNKPSKQIAKQFGISEMQVWRIKSGENWSSVKIPD